MERELDGSRIDAEDSISKKYSEIFGRPMVYRIVVTRYKEGPNGTREMIWDENPNPVKTSGNE